MQDLLDTFLNELKKGTTKYSSGKIAGVFSGIQTRIPQEFKQEFLRNSFGFIPEIPPEVFSEISSKFHANFLPESPGDFRGRNPEGISSEAGKRYAERR